jgi:SAM-dependent methyltransferase
MNMDDKTIKEQVKSHYAAIAQSGGCCGPLPASQSSSCCSTAASSQSSCCSSDSVTVNPLVDYSSLELIPVEGSDLGLGCGMPTRFAALKPGETVLDLGSGAGIDVFLAAKQVGETGFAIGVDMTPEMIERAWQNAHKNQVKNVDFRLGEIEALPVEDASVDVVLSNCVINLVPNKRGVFAEIARVLKPGGRFIISDIVSFGDVPREIRKDMELWAGCVAGAIDEQEYLQIVRDNGFVDLKIPTRSSTTLEVSDDSPASAYGMVSITVEARKA